MVVSLPGTSRRCVLFNHAHVCQWQSAARPIIVCLCQSEAEFGWNCDSEQTDGKKSGNWKKLLGQIYDLYCNNFSILNREVGEREGIFLWTWWGNVYSTVTCPVSTSICLKNLSIESLLAPGLLLFNSPCALMFLSKGPNKIGRSPHGISKLTQFLEQ